MRKFWITEKGAIIPAGVTVKYKSGGVGKCLLRYSCKVCAGTGYLLLRGKCSQCLGAGSTDYVETTVYCSDYAGDFLLLNVPVNENIVLAEWIEANNCFVQWMKKASLSNAFIKSLCKRIDCGHYLSERQIEVALKIWHEKNN